MLTLQTFPPAFGLRASSPFAVKAEALLAMAGLAYEREFADLRKAPRGKLPVLVDDGRAIPDTAHIQTHLERVHGADFDGDLSARQRGVATAFRRLVEHHLYFIGGNLRWNDHPEAVREEYFKAVPGLIRGLVFRRVLKDVNRTLHMQGLGRHTREELIAFGRDDIDAIAGQLGEQPFMLGERPRSVDATVYAAMANLLDCTLASPLSDHARTIPTLDAYVRRCEAQFFGA